MYPNMFIMCPSTTDHRCRTDFHYNARIAPAPRTRASTIFNFSLSGVEYRYVSCMIEFMLTTSVPQSLKIYLTACDIYMLPSLVRSLLVASSSSPVDCKEQGQYLARPPCMVSYQSLSRVPENRDPYTSHVTLTSGRSAPLFYVPTMIHDQSKLCGPYNRDTSPTPLLPGGRSQSCQAHAGPAFGARQLMTASHVAFHTAEPP